MNNFDQSSTGIDIQMNIGYDEGRGMDLYDMMFTGCRDIFVVTCDGEYEVPNSIMDLFDWDKITKTEALSLIYDLGFGDMSVLDHAPSKKDIRKNLMETDEEDIHWQDNLDSLAQIPAFLYEAVRISGNNDWTTILIPKEKKEQFKSEKEYRDWVRWLEGIMFYQPIGGLLEVRIPARNVDETVWAADLVNEYYWGETELKTKLVEECNKNEKYTEQEREYIVKWINDNFKIGV